MRPFLECLESRDAPAVLTGQGLQLAYDVPRNAGRGASIWTVIVGTDPSIQSDLNTYDKADHLPSTRVHIHQLGASVAAVGPVDNWPNEGSAAVELEHAMAPLAALHVVEVSSGVPEWSLQAGARYAAMHGATVVCLVQADPAGWDGWFTYQGLPKTLFVAAAGDSPGLVNTPAADPNVLAVGGTNLNVTASGRWKSEGPWPQSPTGESIDPSFGTWPAYAPRPLPDVAATATAAVVLDGQWSGYLGTSVSAAVWAGAAADIPGHGGEATLLPWLQAHAGALHHPRAGGAGSPDVGALERA